MGDIGRLNPLYAAAGSLAYGGSLFGLMAGSIFAGVGLARGYALGACGEGLELPVRSEGGELIVELYYAAAEALAAIDERLGGLAERATVMVRLGDYSVPAYMHLGLRCTPSSASRAGARESGRRLLVLLPPAKPPPATPMASYSVEVPGLSPCPDEPALYCSSTEAYTGVVVEVYTGLSGIAEWAGPGAIVTPVPARLGPYTLYPLAPLRAARGAAEITGA